MNEQKIVQASLQKIFNLNGYSNSESMTQRDYEHISAEIEKKSGIVISGITIKRLSNGAFSRSPQIATLNAFGQQTSNKKDRNNLKDRQSNLTCYFLTY